MNLSNCPKFLIGSQTGCVIPICLSKHPKAIMLCKGNDSRCSSVTTIYKMVLILSQSTVRVGLSRGVSGNLDSGGGGGG